MFCFDRISEDLKRLRRHSTTTSETDDDLLATLENPLENMSRVQVGWYHTGDLQATQSQGKTAVLALVEVLRRLSLLQHPAESPRISRLMSSICTTLANLAEEPELLHLLSRAITFEKCERSSNLLNFNDDNEKQPEVSIMQTLLHQIPGFVQSADKTTPSKKNTNQTDSSNSASCLDWSRKDEFTRLLSKLVATSPKLLTPHQYVSLQPPLFFALMEAKDLDNSPSGMRMLELFAACCIASLHFRQTIKTLPSSKRKLCYRRLLSFLDTQNQPQAMLNALLALMALLSGDSLEQKIFDTANIEQAALLTFGQVLGSESLSLQRVAVEVLRRLLLIPSAGPILYISGHMNDFLQHALNCLAERIKTDLQQEGQCPPECIFWALHTLLMGSRGFWKCVGNLMVKKADTFSELYLKAILHGIWHHHAPTVVAATHFISTLLRFKIPLGAGYPGDLDQSISLDSDNESWMWLFLNTVPNLQDRSFGISPIRNTGHFSPGYSTEHHGRMRDKSPLKNSFLEENSQDIVVLVVRRLEKLAIDVRLLTSALPEDIATFSGAPMLGAVQKEQECLAVLDLLCALASGSTYILQRLQQHANVEHLSYVVQAQISGLQNIAPFVFPGPPMEIIISATIFLAHLSMNSDGNIRDDVLMRDSVFARRSLLALLTQTEVVAAIGGALWQVENKELTARSLDLLILLKSRKGAESLAAVDIVYNFGLKYISNFWEISERIEKKENEETNLKGLVEKKTLEVAETQTQIAALTERHEALISKMRAQHSEELISLKALCESRCEEFSQKVKHLTQCLSEAEENSEKYRTSVKSFQQKQKKMAFEKVVESEEMTRLRKELIETRTQLEEKSFQLQMMGSKQKETQQNLSQMEAQCTSLQLEINLLQHKLHDKSTENSLVSAEKTSLKQTVHELEHKTEEVYSKLVKLAKAYREKEEECEKCSHQIAQMENEVKKTAQETEHKLEVAENEKKKLTKALQEIQSLYTALKSSTEKLQRMQKFKELELEEVRTKVSTQDSLHFRTKEELQCKINEFDQLRLKFDELQCKYNAQMIELESLQKEMDRQQSIIGYINKLSGHGDVPGPTAT